MTLSSWVISAMLLLAPDRDHGELAEAITHVVETEAPLFRGDESRIRTAALVVAVAFRESTFNNAAIGKTDDYCAMQVHRRPDLLEDAEQCIRVGLGMLRESMRACPSYPLALYASGPEGCTNARAQRISRDRMNLAKWLVGHVEVEP